MKWTLSTLLLLALILFPFDQSHAHGCPVEPDDSLTFNFGLDAQLIWQYGPEVGNKSVLFINLKKTGTAVPTDLALEPNIVIEGPSIRGADPLIAPVLDEKGQVLPGEFRVSNLNFSHLGKWQLHLQLKNTYGVSETQTALVELCGRK